MASTSTQTVRVPKRDPEKVEKPETSRFPSPEPTTKEPRWTIKLAGGIPG